MSTFQKIVVIVDRDFGSPLPWVEMCNFYLERSWSENNHEELWNLIKNKIISRTDINLIDMVEKWDILSYPLMIVKIPADVEWTIEVTCCSDLICKCEYKEEHIVELHRSWTGWGQVDSYNYHKDRIRNLTRCRQSQLKYKRDRCAVERQRQINVLESEITGLKLIRPTTSVINDQITIRESRLAIIHSELIT